MNHHLNIHVTIKYNYIIFIINEKILVENRVNTNAESQNSIRNDIIQYSYYYLPYYQFRDYYPYNDNNYQDLNESGDNEILDNEQYIPYLENNLDEVIQNIQSILNLEK